MQWFYILDGKQQGPVAEEELFRLAREGRIQPTDHVWNETMGGEWRRAGTIAGLFGAAPPPPDYRPSPSVPAGGVAPSRVPSCTAPVGPAWERMVGILFRPFDFGKWFVLGFSAWLATLGEGGGSFNFGGFGDSRSVADMNLRGSMDSARDAFGEHGMTIVLIVGIVVMVGITIAVVLAWLRARGKFMFLDNVVTNRVRVGEAWHEYCEAGSSLFLWMLGYAALALLVFLVLLGVTALSCIAPCVRAGGFIPAVLPGIGICAVLWIAYAIVVGYIGRFLEDFIVPIMYAHGLRASEAWRRFTPVLRANMGRFVVYGLFYWVLTLAAGTAALLFALLTCCLGGCLMALPYVGAVVLLPVSVFFRAYSVGYLAQFGPDFVVPLDRAGPAVAVA